MEQTEPKAPGALSKPEPTGREILEIGEYLKKYREYYGLTQYQAARLLGISRRRIQDFESTTKWNENNKAKIQAFPGIFDFTATHSLTRKGWSSQRSLSAAIQRKIEGKGERKAYTRMPAEKRSADVLRFEEQLRSRYGTKALLTEDSIVLQHYGRQDVLEMLLSKLL